MSLFPVSIQTIISDNFSFFPLFLSHSLWDLLYDFFSKLLTWFSLVLIFFFINLHKVLNLFYLNFFVLHIYFSTTSVSIATLYILQFLRYNIYYCPFETREALIFSSNPYNKLFMRCVHSLSNKVSGRQYCLPLNPLYFFECL